MSLYDVRVGDDIACVGGGRQDSWPIVAILDGRYGRLIMGPEYTWAYLLAELPPDESRPNGWRGWTYCATYTINSQRYASVNMARREVGHRTPEQIVEYYDCLMDGMMAKAFSQVGKGR